ncbi:tRNA (N(6)-L-threonylcarbamoyladenosine(37)-C(2))-methylthiotransferase MtaB [Falsiroseomonas oryzae]|uniref:tRNA (N(6)-L-threonylcarbamoyladenosine(37)-C(2))- methylthiotransferase MtaB n=1 Tax=Falsiroseomonas oryzae TaxID=2766473 RepID=UPI0022EA6C89|nr:tRNA (N(6)-L-threonylcarbamoyladenosine(37)-C(2))-methylthiotransferase MtaB [Roseomonas sp. MO-31]
MTPEVISFGCRLNASESEAMRALAAQAGQDDAIIVNTCAVTAEAEAQARQAIRRAARDNPGRRIVVTGCAAQIAPQAWAALPGVARVIGNADKLDPAIWAALDTPVPVSDVMAARAAPVHPVAHAASRARALVQVQQGCDHRCTFCVIPFGRGPSRSVPPEAVVAQVRALVARGHREVVLTGVDITSYGPDLPGGPTLGALARRVLAEVPDLPRLRLSSLDPAEMDAELWRLLAEEPRLMPHLHLSLQHGSDLILKRMKRRHRRADAVALCDRARRLRPDIAFGADLIAGFPTEGEADVAATLDLIEACGLTFLHVFPYSERPGTPAARMPQLPVPLRRERAARLREAGRAAMRRFLQGRLGRREEVLLEAPDRGHSAHFAPVRLRGVAGARGELRVLRAVACDDDGLIAEAA